MRFIGPAVAMALLAACSQEAPHHRTGPVKVDEKQAAAAIDTAVASDPAAAAKRGLPVATPTSRVAAATNFPIAFQTHWGLTLADCDMSRPDAKGRLNITGNTLDFYESTGKVTRLDKTSEADVTVDVAFKGEGQTWTEHARYALATGGTVLLRAEQSPGKTYRYSRC